MYFFPENLFIFNKINIMLNMSIMVDLRPACFLENEILHYYFPRILSAINEHFWMAAFVFSSNSERVNKEFYSACNI